MCCIAKPLQRYYHFTFLKTSPIHHFGFWIVQILTAYWVWRAKVHCDIATSSIQKMMAIYDIGFLKSWKFMAEMHYHAKVHQSFVDVSKFFCFKMATVTILYFWRLNFWCPLRVWKVYVRRLTECHWKWSNDFWLSRWQPSSILDFYFFLNSLT